MQIMLSEGQQKNVWDGWLSSEIRAQYFADLCQRYQQTQRFITWSTLAASSGACAVLLSELPPGWAWVRLVLAFATTGFSLWALVVNYKTHSTECADLHFRWNTLAIDYESLWNDMYAANAPDRLGELRKRGAELSKSSTSLPNKPDVMRKWQTHVHHHHGIETA